MNTATLSPKTIENSQPALSTVGGTARIAITVALALLLFAFWAVLHRYDGLDRDARVYAFQALSRLHPGLTTDLYLQNTSQDRYTIFSPIYAFFISIFGLENSALWLTMVFTLWFLAAAWAVAQRVAGYELAWLSIALMILTTGDYGAFGVFHFPETYLTARLPAYALIATALAMSLRGHRWTGLCVAGGALLVHPIMAFPGVLLLLCLSVGLRWSVIGVSAGILCTLGIAGAATMLPEMAHMATVMDPAWLEVVKERSQFLFLQLWSIRDWELNARPFLCLAVTASALTGAGRRLSVAAAMIGGAGLLVAFIGGEIGPVAVFVQGQAWRWVWVTSFVAVLLLPQTIYQIWRSEKIGPLCSMFLLLSWTFAPVDGTACAGVALFLWNIRRNLTGRLEKLVRWAAVALALVIIVWIIATAWNTTLSATAESGRESTILTKLRNFLGLGISAALVFGAAWYWTLKRSSVRGAVVLSVGLLILSVTTMRRSMEQLEPVDSAVYLAEFSDWRAAIPETSTVFVTPAQDSGKFVWFKLQRPNYLSADQSAGVVFSRKTALEVERRSEVLLPVEDPSWRLLSALTRHHAAPGAVSEPFRPLTTQSLASLCLDPKLDFVASNVKVGFSPVRQMDHGKWKGWSLYECRNVRLQSPAA